VSSTRKMTRPNDAELYAAAFVDHHGTDCGRRLAEIAEQLSLQVKDVDADNFDGMLFRVAGANRARILLNENIREPGRKRFTFAHELGHYIMPSHGREGSICRAADVETWDEQIRATEREANTFAASILMPDVVCRQFVRKEPAFRHVESMKDACRTSLTATLVRYAQLSSFAVAMVYGQGGAIRWSVRSTEFPFFIPKRQLSADTFAADAYAGRDVPDEFESVPASAWLDDYRLLDGARILEVSRHLTRYDATVTLLHARTALIAASDEPDDNELDPRDFTLERRNWPRKR
jgi:Zn-dependent peptidase ImmA (M78 family)